MTYDKKTNTIKADEGKVLHCFLNGLFYDEFCLSTKIYYNGKYKTLTIDNFKEK